MSTQQAKFVPHYQHPDQLAAYHKANGPAWRERFETLLKDAEVEYKTLHDLLMRFDALVEADPVQKVSAHKVLNTVAHFKEVNSSEGYGIAWVNASGETEVFDGSSLEEIVFAYLNRIQNTELCRGADEIMDELFGYRPRIRDMVIDEIGELLANFMVVLVPDYPADTFASPVKKAEKMAFPELPRNVWRSSAPYLITLTDGTRLPAWPVLAKIEDETLYFGEACKEPMWLINDSMIEHAAIKRLFKGAIIETDAVQRWEAL